MSGCPAALEAPEDVEAPQKPVVKASAPCSFIEPSGWCKQSYDEDGMTCDMDWEEDGLCSDKGYSVCCEGHYSIQLWGKPGTQCTGEMKPCSSEALDANMSGCERDCHVLYGRCMSSGGYKSACDQILEKCMSGCPAALEAPEDVEAPQQAVVAVKDLAVQAPCSFVEPSGWCKEAADQDACDMSWEESGTCGARGYTKCCEGHYSIQLWGKPGTECTGELHECSSLEEAPQQAVVAVKNAVPGGPAKELSANAPCHYLSG